jgi:NADH-quinone oxidoreductase subunit M
MTGLWSFDYFDLAKTPITDTWQSLIFVLLFYGCAVRLAQFPFHAWLPIVAQHGTLATVCVFLVGLKVGIYALIRFALPLLPSGVIDWQNFVVSLGVMGIFYGAALALMQLGMRRLLAFAAVSNTGMLVVGVFSLDTEGLAGTVLLSVNFGVAASGMLFTTGLLHRRTRTTLLPRLGGMFELTPLLGLTFLIAALSTMTMPGTPGFDAAHLLLEGAIGAHDWGIAIAVVCGNVLTAAFLLWAFQRTFLAERKEQALRLTEIRLTRAEAALTAIVCMVLIGVGFYTEPWVELVTRPLTAMTERYQSVESRSK